MQFLRVAQGSIKELETHFLIAHRVGFIEVIEYDPINLKCVEIGKMTRALIRSLQGNKNE